MHQLYIGDVVKQLTDSVPCLTNYPESKPSRSEMRFYPEKLPRCKNQSMIKLLAFSEGPCELADTFDINTVQSWAKVYDGVNGSWDFKKTLPLLPNRSNNLLLTVINNRITDINALQVQVLAKWKEAAADLKAAGLVVEVRSSYLVHAAGIDSLSLELECSKFRGSSVVGEFAKFTVTITSDSIVWHVASKDYKCSAAEMLEQKGIK